MGKPGLLLWSEGAQQLLGDALSDEFEIIRLWQALDFDAVLRERGKEIIATLTSELDSAVLDRLPNLRLVAVPGAGYEKIDVALLRARGIRIANAGDAHSSDVADHAVALAIASIQRLTEMHAWVLEGCWSRHGAPPRRRGMSAQRFGIVGLGHIGTAIARRLVPFGAEIAWWSRQHRPAPWPRRDSLLDLARWCTTLIIATRGDAVKLIDANIISAVGPDGLIVNIARGRVIDEEALIAALKQGRLGRAALDVFMEEPTPPERWRDVPNVILSPHVAGASYESIHRLRDAAILNIRSALHGGPVAHEVSE
jgi:hydroxypyruvate reductase